MLREIKSSQRLVRVLNFKVKGTGTAAIQQGINDGTLVDNGTGDWTITFAKAGKRILGAQVTPFSDTGDIIPTFQVAGFLVSGVRILGWDGTDGTTAKDMDFMLSVTLSDTADET